MQVIPSMTKSECMYALHWIDRLCVRSKNKECVFSCPDVSYSLFSI